MSIDEDIAMRYDLDVSVVKAIIQTESNGDVYAWRYEPPYRYLWNVKWNTAFRKLTEQEIREDRPPSDFHSNIGSRATEWVGQQASWGRMQIMGAVAREYGYARHFPELCSVLGIEYGCMHLARLKKRFFDKYGLQGVIAAYNAGTPRKTDSGWENQAYVDKVLAHMNDINKSLG